MYHYRDKVCFPLKKGSALTAEQHLLKTDRQFIMPARFAFDYSARR